MCEIKQVVKLFAFCPSRDVKSLDFVVTGFHFLVKLFRTVNHDVIRDCCKFLEFTITKSGHSTGILALTRTVCLFSILSLVKYH